MASNLVAGVDRFLLRKTDEISERPASQAPLPGEERNRWIATNRESFARILGVRDARVSRVEMELVGSPERPALVGRGANFEIFAVRWRAFADVHGEGLMLVPTGRRAVADVVAIPDASQTPEQIAGLVEGIPAESQFARRLAESGCRVIVPVLINRERDILPPLSNREFVYRPAYELGRHVIGYEIEKIQAAVDWLAAQSGQRAGKIGVAGWGEGGLLAFYAAALDPRIDAACVSGFFDDRRGVWKQPVDRNVFGLLNKFGDAEVAGMIAPRTLVIEASRGPELVLEGKGGAPGVLTSPSFETVRKEFERARAESKNAGWPIFLTGDGAGAYGGDEALSKFLGGLNDAARLSPAQGAPEKLVADFDSRARQARQVHELDRHSQWLLSESPYVREKFMAKLDTSSPERFRASDEEYRQFFYNDVIGHFDEPMLPANPRSRKEYDEQKWTGYEVALDVFPDVIAYGVLLLPKDLKAGERRPVVVCQHGLESHAQDTIAGDSKYYHNFAAKLCEEGFITFAPQNLYIFEDRFRTLQRKANPLGKTLYSIIIPQHQQITEWLKSLPFVDPTRIGFYGLSYGGKTAMRVPAVVTNYCLSICSGDFNDWVWKNASTRSPYSYATKGEYEIFEFDLGSTFNYSEMTALIAPRPFMVERGHLDGVAPDEAVAYEFAKTRFLYESRLGLKDQCVLEWFNGPHTIHGVGTFEFLRKHLDWKPQ
jgi:dienelactone hydrolase